MRRSLLLAAMLSMATAAGAQVCEDPLALRFLSCPAGVTCSTKLGDLNWTEEDKNIRSIGHLCREIDAMRCPGPDQIVEYDASGDPQCIPTPASEIPTGNNGEILFLTGGQLDTNPNFRFSTGNGFLGVGILPTETLHLTGGMILGSNNQSADGTMRYTGTDFEGRLSGGWVSMTAGGGGGSGDITDVGSCSTGACFQSETARHAFLAPTGGGVATFRAITQADISDFLVGVGGAGLQVSGSVLSTASTESAFLNDGGVTNLTCGGTGGKMQVMDNGSLQYCDGATASVLRTAMNLGGAQTITGNKTFSSSTLAVNTVGWTNANHTHAGVTTGGQVAISDTTGTLAIARGGIGATSFAAAGLVVTTDIDTEAELETIMGGINLVTTDDPLTSAPVYLANAFILPSGSTCSGQDVQPVANGPTEGAVTCTDAATSSFEVTFFDDLYTGGTVTVELGAYHTGTPASNLTEFDIECQCVTPGTDTPAAWADDSSEEPCQVNFDTADRFETCGTASITPNGSCAAGDLLLCEVQVDDGQTTESMADVFVTWARLKVPVDWE